MDIRNMTMHERLQFIADLFQSGIADDTKVTVGQCYEDYDARLMWTTLIAKRVRTARGKVFEDSWQMVTPRQMDYIRAATNSYDLIDVAWMIKDDNKNLIKWNLEW